MSTATTAREQMTRKEYHDDHSAVSHSMLEVFIRNVAEYQGRFVGHTIPDPQSTESQDFGTLTHLFVLEPDKFAEQCDVLPPAPGGKWDKRTKAYKDTIALYSESGRQPLEHEAYRRLQQIRDAIHRHPKAKAILDRSQSREVPIYWTDSISGLRCKCLVDALGNFIVDLKTCQDASPNEFKHVARKFGYHRQAPHYSTGVKEGLGTVLPHTFICVTTEPPFECAVNSLGPRTMWLGEEQNRKALVELARRIESGDWVSDHSKKINEVEFDNWVFVKDATEI